jgi:hypothetical protein
MKSKAGAGDGAGAGMKTWAGVGFGNGEEQETAQCWRWAMGSVEGEGGHFHPAGLAGIGNESRAVRRMSGHHSSTCDQRGTVPGLGCAAER